MHEQNVEFGNLIPRKFNFWREIFAMLREKNKTNKKHCKSVHCFSHIPAVLVKHDHAFNTCLYSYTKYFDNDVIERKFISQQLVHHCTEDVIICV